jgi:1-phosphofructokinase family hexose kinase
MILIISLNLAIDKVLYVDELKIFSENRVKLISSLPGGKGVNVARCLKSFGKVSYVSGFIGGYNGKYIEDGLKKEGIYYILQEIEFENRVCNIIVDKFKNITEVYEIGPEINEQAFICLLEKIKFRKESFQYIIISGSIPRGIKDQDFLKFIDIFKDRKIFLDIHGDFLLKILENYEIFFLKINEKEFINTFKDEKENIFESLKNIYKKYKIFLFVITLGDKGAIFAYKDKIYKIFSKMNVLKINPVGAGDAFMGGFVYGIDEGMNIFDALKYGISASISNVTLYEGGKVNIEIFDEILKNIIIEEVY